MPFWRIYSNANTFSDEQKAGLSEAITKLYSNRPDGLPAFYVVTVFTPLGDGDIFVGGKKHKDFVRITVEQIARAMPSPETEEGRIRRRGWMERINEVSSTETSEMGQARRVVAHKHVTGTEAVHSRPRRDQLGDPHQ